VIKANKLASGSAVKFGCYCSG